MIHFTLNLKPQPKQRPRFNSRSKRVFTEKETIKFERSVRTLAMSHISEPLIGSIGLDMTFVYPRLQSEPKSRPERKYKATRPDLSNLIKSLEDGLQSVAFNDDAQIVSLNAEKVYGALGELPHIEVTIYQLNSYGRYKAGGERRERAHEKYSANQERRALKEKRRAKNRAEHKAEQKAKHEHLAHERGKRKLEEAQVKLQQKERERKTEKAVEEEKRRRELNSIYEQMRSRFLPDQEANDE